MTEPMDLPGFIRWLLEERVQNVDLDGGSLQVALVSHGLLFERPATEADCLEKWARENGYEVGDIMLDATPQLRAFLDGESPA